MGNLITLDTNTVTRHVSNVLRNFSEIAGAYLFGSALGKCRPDSDIDIGLVSENIWLTEKEAAQLESKVALSLKPFEGHLYDIAFLSPRHPIFSFRVIKEGKLVYVRDMERIRDLMELVSRRYADVYPRYRLALEEIMAEVVSGGS